MAVLRLEAWGSRRAVGHYGLDWKPMGAKGSRGGLCRGSSATAAGEGHISMRDDTKWQSKLAQARADGAWGALDVYSDGGADGTDTPAASAEYA